MKTAFVIGNGESRKNFDLTLLKGKGIIVGCNALYRDFTPDILVAVDSRMIKEIKESALKLRSCDIYVRYRSKSLQSLRTKEIIEDGGQASGINALNIVCSKYRKTLITVYMLGFDLYPLDTGKINNLYKDTECYNKADHKGIEPTVWIRKLKEVFEKYSSIQFKRVGNIKDKFPVKWNKLSNIKFITYEEFLSCL